VAEPSSFTSGVDQKSSTSTTHSPYCHSRGQERNQSAARGAATARRVIAGDPQKQGVVVTHLKLLHGSIILLGLFSVGCCETR
jgi:hypothetical protein